MTYYKRPEAQVAKTPIQPFTLFFLMVTNCPHGIAIIFMEGAGAGVQSLTLSV